MTGITADRVWPIGLVHPADHLLPLLPGTLLVAFGLEACGYFPRPPHWAYSR